MKDSKYSLNLTQGPIGHTLLLFFLPIAAGNLFQQLYNTADALIIAKFVGREALAAVGGSPAQVINVVISFFTALSAGAGVTISHAFGSGHSERISRSSNTAIMLSILLGLVSMALGWIFTPAILSFMKTPADTMGGAITYLRIYFCGMVFNMLYNMASGILRAVGDSKRPLYALVACCLTNIGLDILFVVAFGMGVAGVAFATILSQFFSAAIVMYFLFSTKEAFRVTPRTLCMHLNSLRRILEIGIPTALQSSMYSISNFIIQIALNSLGTVVVASWSMAGKIDGVYWAISSALGTAIMSFVGQNYGAGKKERILGCAKLGMLISLLITVGLVVLILFFGHYGVQLLIDDAEVIDCTWQMLSFFVPYYFLWTAIEVFTGILRGMGDALIPVIITGIGICVFRILWIILLFPVFHTVRGLTACYPASWAITAVAMLIYYLIKRRRILLEPHYAEPND